MITTELYDGQGLGNQLWSYAVCRTLAMNLGVPFGIQSYERFKGAAFMTLDFGEVVEGASHDGPSEELPRGVSHYFRERSVRHPVTGDDITSYDAALLGVRDGTKLDGNLQAEKYIEHRRLEVATWYQSTLDASVDPGDVCVISFRGGEYKYHPDLLLPQTFFRNAMANMRDLHPGVEFVVVTDDPKFARSYFPDLQVVSHRRIRWHRRLGIHPPSRAIGGDFTWVQRAPYLILSNSSFSWWGAWTNLRAVDVIAPKYWARHNVSDGYWAQGDSLTRGWWWQDRVGRLEDFEECARQLAAFREQHAWAR